MIKFLFGFIIEPIILIRLAAKYHQIDGWISSLEGILLYLLAKYGPGKGEIVEIGSFKGKSTIWLAKGSQAASREKVTAVDPHKGSTEHHKDPNLSIHLPKGGTLKEFKKNLRKFKVENYVFPIRGTSEKALSKWRKPIRLLFIDGDHRYKNVKRDFFGWEKYVSHGALIALHDIGVWDGPTRVLTNDLRGSKEFLKLVQLGSTAVILKR